MGRRSRKRIPSGAPRTPVTERPAARSRPAPASPRRRARLDEAPKPPWAPFPLVELCILAGLVMLGFGFFGSGARTGLLIGIGLGLVTLATLEVSLREHFAGFRSHSLLLAGVLAAGAVAALAFAAGLGRLPAVAAGVVVFGAAFWALREAFRRRAGGLGFRA